ncbi:hypothetical protein FSP39_014656 [Pinctada imbricata]|uniref:Dual specificity protein phosphatase n=1 Tax=Pinctada imbricata TaxID=66713 RepID=A0AA88XL82_PINIB|nr:hypothetical protein FSP39_014656 [Pinctada imbricata]
MTSEGSPDQSEILREVNDFLKSQEKEVGSGSSKPAPFGAKPSVWMGLPPVPKDNFNEVFPNLFLGDYKISKDKDELKKVGITHLVNCAQGTKYNQIDTDENYFADSGICFHGIQAMDSFGFKMTPFFDNAAEFIHNALQSEGKVYVHCQSGVSRSATIVLAFLMLKRRMRLLDAIKMIREKRPAQPNGGFLKQLSELDATLCKQ